MATFTDGMTDAEIERARNNPDKKVVDGEHVNCEKCGHDEMVVTYYPAIDGRDRTCTNCLKTV